MSSKRNLPSWMTSNDDDGHGNFGKRPTLDGGGKNSSEIGTSNKKTKVENENAFNKLMVID